MPSPILARSCSQLPYISFPSSLKGSLQLTASHDVLAIPEPMEPDVWHQDIPIVRHKVLNDVWRVLDNINIPPVDPRVLRLHGSVKQVVPRAPKSLPPGSLIFEAMPVLNILGDGDSPILLDNHDAVEGNFRVALDPVNLLG